MTPQFLRMATPVLCWILSFCPTILPAQFNLETGYSYSFFQPTALNGILHSYEHDRKDLIASLGDTKGLHGMELAGVYHWESLTVGAFWSLKRDRNKVEYTGSDGSTALEESVTFNNNLIGVVLQSNIERFSIGTRTGYDFVKIKFKGNSELPDREHLMDGGFASQFFVSYTLPGSDNLRIMFRPFYQINWYTPDFMPLAQALEVPNIVAERTQIFGLSLIFVNGSNRFH